MTVNWLVGSDDQVDAYALWGYTSLVETVNPNAERSDPPWARIFKRPDIATTTFTTGNNSYALVAHSAGRSSPTASTDPWYLTSTVNSTQAPNAVAHGRPALSCWQQDTYHFGGSVSTSVFHLDQLPGLNLPPVWHELLQSEFAAPKIVDIVESLSRSTLLSSTTFNSDGTTNVFDAASAELGKDMKRLIWATFVATTNTFTNTVLVDNTYGIDNAALVNGVPGERVGEFVVSTREIATLDFNILIALPVTMAGLVVVLCLLYLVKSGKNTTD
jgi:hypothetical protein